LYVVSDIEDTSVVLDANRPVAGEDLLFEVELLEVA
jgi:FKBP-type peptidyl-prolyl cis-trans isomerase 2